MGVAWWRRWRHRVQITLALSGLPEHVLVRAGWPPEVSIVYRCHLRWLFPSDYSKQIETSISTTSKHFEQAKITYIVVCPSRHGATHPSRAYHCEKEAG